MILSPAAKLTEELDEWLGSVPADESKRAGVRAVIGPCVPAPGRLF